MQWIQLSETNLQSLQERISVRGLFRWMDEHPRRLTSHDVVLVHEQYRRIVHQGKGCTLGTEPGPKSIWSAARQWQGAQKSLASAYGGQSSAPCPDFEDGTHSVVGGCFAFCVGILCFKTFCVGL
jgi:hypothetical protein